MNQQQTINQWEKATNELANYFVKKYFDFDADYGWMSDDVGGVLFVNDYFFDISDITDFLRYKYSKKDMFEYYDYKLEEQDKDTIVINIKSWKKLK